MFVVEPREIVRVPETFKLWGFQKIDESFQRKNWKISKGLKVSKWVQNETKEIWFFETISIRVFWNKNWVLTKNHDFWKKCRGNNFAVECDRISKTSQKVQKIWAGLEKRWVFQKESRIFQKWLDVANLL